MLARNDGGADLHRDDPAHAAKVGADLTLFKRALNGTHVELSVH